jgi:hypothetical protein
MPHKGEFRVAMLKNRKVNKSKHKADIRDLLKRVKIAKRRLPARPPRSAWPEEKRLEYTYIAGLWQILDGVDDSLRQAIGIAETIDEKPWQKKTKG